MKDFSVDGCVRKFIEGGASPSSINIGLPFYGRSFKKAKGLDEPHEGNDLDMWYLDDGSPQYFNIVEKLPELVSVRHELTHTQYAYKDSGGLVSYDDEQAICDKTQYVSNLCITSLSAKSVGMTNLVTTNSFNLHSVLITI